MRAQGASNKILCNYFSISRALPALVGSSLTRNLCFWTKRKSSFLHKTCILSTLVSKLLSVGGSVPGFPLLAVFEICRWRCRNKKQKHDKLTKSHRRRSEIKSGGEAENKLYIPFFSALRLWKWSDFWASVRPDRNWREMKRHAKISFWTS